MYNPKNIGFVFIALGGFLFFMVAGEFAIRIVFIALSLVCIDYGLRLMGRPPLLVMIQNWFDNLRV